MNPSPEQGGGAGIGGLDSIRSVFVVKPSSLGDIVHTCPAVHFLKQACPHLEITWLANTEWAPLLSENPDVSSVILFPRNSFRGLGGVARLSAWLRRIARLKPDLVLDFQGLARSAFISRISGARRIHCLSDAEILPRLLATRTIVAKRSEEHAIDRYLRLVADLGVPVEGPPCFNLPQGLPPRAAGLPGEYILLHPFARGAGKSLSPAALSLLCQALSPLPVVIAGHGGPLSGLPAHCLDLTNQTSLLELIWLIRRASYVVSVDSGPMHIASAVTDHLLGIHTWSDPRLVGPYNPMNSVWKGGRILSVKKWKETPKSAVLTAQPFDDEAAMQVAEFLSRQLALRTS